MLVALAAVPAAAVRVLVLFAAAAGATFGSFFVPFTTFLNSCPARNAGTEVFFTFTFSPVAGLRAVRAARSRFSKTPKPVRATFSPFDTVRYTVSSRASTVAAVRFLSSPSRADSASTSWALFTASSPGLFSAGRPICGER